MTTNEKHPNEGRLEKLARLGIIKNLGGLAIAGAAAVLLPPAGAAIAAGLAVGEGAGAIASKVAYDHLKNRRLKKTAR